MARTHTRNIFTTALVNTRSLLPKLRSFPKVLNGLQADVCIVTETWFQKCDKINSLLQDFKHLHCYSFLCRDRQTGKRGGGIAICFDHEHIQLQQAKLPPSKHELLGAIGRRKGQRRKIAIIAAYLPPWYNADQDRSFHNAVNKAIRAIKSKYDDPYILVAGDLNRRDIRAATSEFPNIKPILTGPTRNDAVLDVIASNFNSDLVDQGTTSPIENSQGVPSDHNTVFAQFRMQRVPAYTIQKYSYYHITKQGYEQFGDWLREQSWEGISMEKPVDQQVDRLHELFEEGMVQSFEWKTRSKKSSEPCWMTDTIREIIEDRRKMFKTDGFRATRWKILKRKTSTIIKARIANCTTNTFCRNSRVVRIQRISSECQLPPRRQH